MQEENLQEENVQSNGTGVDTQSGSTDEGNEKKRKDPIITFGKKIHDYDEAIQISIDDEGFRWYVEQYGFNLERLNEGKALVTSTEAANDLKKEKKAQQHAATLEVHALRKDASRTLSDIVKIGRVAFKDDHGMLEELGLLSYDKYGFGDWLNHSKYIYRKILGTPDALAGYANYNITQEKLEAGQQKVFDTEAAHANRQRLKADAENATAEKNKAFRKLESWMRKYLKVVDIALEDAPQYKEKVGIVVPYLQR